MKTSLPDKTQHSQQKYIHATCAIRTRKPYRRAASDPRHRQRGHLDHLQANIGVKQLKVVSLITFCVDRDISPYVEVWELNLFYVKYWPEDDLNLDRNMLPRYLYISTSNNNNNNNKCTKLNSNKSRRQGDYTMESASAN